MGDRSLKLEYDRDGRLKSNPYLLALSPAPYVQELVLNQDDEFIVLACDGLFDVMTNQQVVDWIRANRDRSDDTKVLNHPDHNEELASGAPRLGKPMTLLKSQSNQIALMVASNSNNSGNAASDPMAHSRGGDLLEAAGDDDYKPNLAQELAHYAVKLGSMDNVSVVIIFLDDIPAQTQAQAQAREKQEKQAAAEKKKLEKELKKQEKKRIAKEKTLRKQGKQIEASAQNDAEDAIPPEFAQEAEADQQ